MRPESLQPAKHQVLVVDDEPQILTSLEDLLSDEFEILTSISPENALNMIDREPRIAVVLSDQRMPQMHGDVLLSHIRKRSDAARLLVTGYADLSAVIRAVNEGQIFAYVTKPWNPESLKHMVHVAADHVRLARDLSLERKLLTEIIDAVPDAIAFTDTEQRFQRVNRAYAHAVGKTQAELLGQRGRPMAGHSVLVTSGLSPFPDSPPPEALKVDEARGNRAEAERWFETIQAPVAAPTGDRIGQVAISRDITQRRFAEQALRDSEERLRLMFEGSGAGLFDWNIPDGEVAYSPSRRHDAEPLGEGRQSYAQLCDRIHPDDRERWDSMLDDHMRRRLPFSSVELRVRGQSGYRWFELSGQAVWDAAGSPLRLVGSSLDITERKAQEQRISRLTRTHAFLSGVSSVILRASDRAGLMQQSCELAVQVGGLTLAVALAIDGELGCCRAVGWSGKSESWVAHVEHWLTGELQRRGGTIAVALEARQHAVLTDIGNVSSTEAQELRAAPYQAAVILPVPTDDRIDNVLVLFSEESEFFDQELLLVLVELAGNVGFAFDHLVQSERLALIAYYDELTGLANRSLLLDRVEHQVAVCKEHGGQFALVILDIGRFRHVNETLGRRLGDRLLVEVGNQLREVIGTKDTLGRVHGDTFVILLANVQDAANVAQWLEHRVLSKLKEPVILDGTELRLTLKVGIALYPSDASNVEALYQNAETAHKKAKVGGQDYLFYTPSMNARVAEKLTLETKLRRALGNNEFLLHYQPKVELRTGLIVGGEALIRWHDPEKGLTPPAVFIPILEETGMILDVGRWVLSQAASDYSDWATRGLEPPRIAVNVSALQLSHPDFVKSLEVVLGRYPLAIHGLELEITESLLMEDLEGSLAKLRSARSMGFTVSIDDFGTGYSSLGYLSRLPIDGLKIDRSFVVRMADDPREMSIVMTIISLAQGLELKVVAEGVETSDQARLLRLLKCDQIQGYLVAKPQPGEDFIRLLGRPHAL
jgi:diguanylate cyclase (GGDEF)-like protein/PAS domain S-box-containing protein